jgi:hypothetical protein
VIDKIFLFSSSPFLPQLIRKGEEEEKEKRGLLLAS